MTTKKNTKPRHGVTRADLTDAVYQRHGGLTKSEAAEVVNKIFETVKVNLLEGRQVKIQNFGVFEVKERKLGASLRLWTSTERVRVWFDDVQLVRVK